MIIKCIEQWGKKTKNCHYENNLFKKNFKTFILYFVHSMQGNQFTFFFSSIDQVINYFIFLNRLFLKKIGFTNKYISYLRKQLSARMYVCMSVPIFILCVRPSITFSTQSCKSVRSSRFQPTHVSPSVRPSVKFSTLLKKACAAY